MKRCTHKTLQQIFCYHPSSTIQASRWPWPWRSSKRKPTLKVVAFLFPFFLLVGVFLVRLGWIKTVCPQIMFNLADILSLIIVQFKCSFVVRFFYFLPWMNFCYFFFNKFIMNPLCVTYHILIPYSLRKIINK